MNFKALDRGEFLACIGGVLLAISLLLSSGTRSVTANAVLNSCHGPNTSCSGWNSLTILRYLLLLVALVPPPSCS